MSGKESQTHVPSNFCSPVEYPFEYWDAGIGIVIRDGLWFTGSVDGKDSQQKHK